MTSLITKYLGIEVQAEIALNLSLKLGENRDNLNALYELLDGLDLKNSQIYANTLEFIRGEIYVGHTDETILKVINKVDQLNVDLIDLVTVSLKEYIRKNSGWFLLKYEVHSREAILKESTDELLNGDSEASIELVNIAESTEHNQTILHLLNFLEMLFRSNNNTTSLDSLLLILLGINDTTISNLISKLLRWRISNIVLEIKESKIWEIIFTLQEAELVSHKSHSFILWLRYLTCFSVEATNGTFEEIVTTDQYWKLLQSGLVSNSHDHRKFCLSILQLTVKSIDFSFENELIAWDNTKKNIHLKEWARFITLFEILGIDTALHQAEAGSKEITTLISPNSLIHPSWGFCLLSTGFKASMDSVRKFSLKLLLSVPDENIYLVKHGLPFLEDVFLPYAMMAMHFIVRENKCEYGSKITTFISSMITKLNDLDQRDIVEAILRVLSKHRGSFDPARIYITHGVLLGLDSNVLQWGRHDISLIELFETHCEGEVFETTAQTLNLRLLGYFQNDSESLFRVLTKFVKFNGYEIFNENLTLIKSWVSGLNIKAAVTLDMNAEQGNSQNIYEVILLGHQPVNTATLLKVLEFGIPEINTSLINNLTGKEWLTEDSLASLSKTKFTGCKNIVAKFNLNDIWTSLIEDIQLDDYHKLTLTAQKHSFFNQLYSEAPLGLSFQQISDFKEKFLINSSNLEKSVKNFYKLKDELSGEFFRTLKIYSRTDDSNFPQILSWMDANSSNYECNFSMVELIQNHIVKTEAVNSEGICEFLGELWDSLDTKRLQLSQKELHLVFIDTFLNPKLVHNHQVKVFCLSIIENSSGRRSLLPRLTTNLSVLVNSYSSSLSSLEWLPEVLVKSIVCFQLRSNLFKLENIIGELYDNQISNSKILLYFSKNGPEEISSRINLMAIFNSVKSVEFATSIFEYLLSVESDYHLFKVIRQVDGFEEWRRIQLFSILLSIVDKISIDLELFFGLLQSDPSPRVRIYIEWIVAYSLTEEFMDRIFKLLLQKGSSAILKPTTVISYQRILFLKIQTFHGEKELSFLSKLLTVVIPGGTSNKALVRHFSVSLTVSIYQEIKDKNLTLDANLVEMLQSMYNAALGSDEFFQYRSGEALLWDIQSDLTLVGISGSVLLRLSDRDDIENISEADFKRYLSAEQTSNLIHPIGQDRKELWVRERKQYHLKPITPSTEQTALQTKSGAWNTVMDVDETNRGSEIVRSDLIVVSSLVDKPPNLGGICRLCDVLGAGLLTLNDINVQYHQVFKSVAVTAEQWMPMIEVKATLIKEYMQLKKREGYTLVGLEQTDESVVLDNNLKLPKKTLILIGREKEGIPGDLLAELDLCVEIKQVGVVRSMNIQTATAILVNAYSMQYN